MITRRDPNVGRAFDLRIDGTGVMLRPQADGSDLVGRRMVELEEASQLDNIRARGFVLELRFTIIAADRVRRRDGKVDTLSSGKQILRLVQRAAARGGPSPTSFAFASGETLTGSIFEYSPTLRRTWPVPAWDVTVTVHQPVPVV